jgi:sugar phosphate isomerase/epimerase
MTVTRRELLSSTAMAALGLAAVRPAQAAPACGEKSKAVLRLSSQLGPIPAKPLPEKLALMEQWGFDAVELPGNCVGKEEEFEKALKNSRLKISALCWGSAKGALVSEIPERRVEGIQLLKQAIDTASRFGSIGVIYVPAFNKQTRLTNQEIRAILLDTLPAIGEYAVQKNTRVLLEPLNRKEAFFLRQLADAAAICRDCNTPGVQMMGDFYHMAVEETSAMGAFLSAGPYLRHVHLASKTRVMPGQDPEDAAFYQDGFRGLKAIGFREHCSFECGCRGDRKVEIPKAMQFLREQWEKA